MIRVMATTHSEADLGWAAGILDGEGCISISTRRSYAGPHAQLHQFVVTVSGCDYRIPRKLHAMFGGKLNEVHARRIKPQWNEALRWSVYQRQAAEVLEVLIPYLVSKREQAEVALEFIATMAPR